MMSINPNINSATAFAPATCANVAVGFDILGFALQDVGDTVTLTKRNDSKITIALIDSEHSLPMDVDKNTASYVIKKITEELRLNIGFDIKIKKGIPLSSGMGGSAASAVAALLAFTGFLNVNSPLSREQLARFALMAEEMSSGQAHADNIVPCLWGGFTLIKSVNPIDVIALPIPENLFYVVIHPDLRVSTKEARKVLSDKVLLNDAVKQSAHLAVFISGLYTGNMVGCRHFLDDVLIEPQRAHLIPGFHDIKAAALKAGALGFSFSGSGSSVFALAESLEEASDVRDAIQSQFKKHNINSTDHVSRISKQAAYITNLT